MNPKPRVHASRAALFLAAMILLASAGFVRANAAEASMSITVSMERPTTHYYHVVFRVDGLKGETLDFKLPVWTPGYYRIMDYAKNVMGFRAEDGTGRSLEWEKTAKNTWRVRSGNDNSVVVSYDVYAFVRFVADSYLGDDGGFITPAGVFMHIAGRLRNPVTVTVLPHPEWKKVSTGLDPVPGRPYTFTAPDFDTLYDCPILIGNQEVLPFEASGVPHTVAAYDLGSVDRTKFVADLKKIVETSAALMGELPYRHYTFLIIGPGGGGLEHLNSTAVTLNPASLADPRAYERWLAFIAHEYFHLFNVKAIRPIALGPFDYDRENYTNMLWVAEGVTVYYEYIILNRAGLMTRDEVLERLGSTIARYENAPGRRHQPANASSFDAWGDPFARGEHPANTTISYYDIGAGLGLLLDLKVRASTKGRASLDDAMRTLYRTFYKEKKRGYTDREFREVCERTAGSPLEEIFDVYAATVKGMDYRKYLAYAGLAIDIEAHEASGPWLGASTRDQNGIPVVSSVELDSPASLAGLSTQDEILALDGRRVAQRTLAETVNARQAGDKVRVLFARRGKVLETEVVLGKKMERSFRISPLADPTPDQKALLDGWLRPAARPSSEATVRESAESQPKLSGSVGGPEAALRSVLLEDLTWLEAEKILPEYEVALIALGARTKEHGPHLLLKNDYLMAEYCRRRVSEEVPVIVLPTLQYGYYPAFLEYPGSISIGAETFKNVVMDICRSMHGYGMKKFYVLNTGVSTVRPLARAAEELAPSGITLRFLNILEVDKILPADLLRQEGGTHADEGETSMMLEIAPETVDISKAVKDFDARPGRRGLTRKPDGAGNFSPSGVYGDPTLATKEKGRIIVEAVVREVVKQVRDLIALKY